MSETLPEEPKLSNPARRHLIRIAAAAAGVASGLGIGRASADERSEDRTGWWHGNHHRHRHGHGHGSGHGGISCFGRGTLIRTTSGDIPVEALTVGTLVVTSDHARPVKWLASQTLRRKAKDRWPDHALPVRLNPGAIADDVPRRPLHLSQDHALYMNGVLIPVKYLVNGRSIALDGSAKTADAIEYFHVELESHQVIFAEGAAVESFRYIGERPNWDNLDDYLALYGPPVSTVPYATTLSYPTVAAEIGGLMRLAVSRFVDVRDPIHIAHERLAARMRDTAA